MRRLRETRNLKHSMAVKALHQVKQEDSILILALNATSLAKYHKDTQDDPDMKQADLLFFSETRISASHDCSELALSTHHAAKLVPAQQTGSGPLANGSIMQLKTSAFPGTGHCIIEQRAGGSEILC